MEAIPPYIMRNVFVTLGTLFGMDLEKLCVILLIFLYRTKWSYSHPAGSRSDDYRNPNSDIYDRDYDDVETDKKIYDDVKAKKDHYHHHKSIQDEIFGQLDRVKMLKHTMNSKLAISEEMPRIRTTLQSKIEHLRKKLKRYEATKKVLNRNLKRLMFLNKHEDKQLKANLYLENEHAKDSRLEARPNMDEGDDINDEDIDKDRRFESNFYLADDDDIDDEETIVEDKKVGLADEDGDISDEEEERQSESNVYLADYGDIDEDIIEEEKQFESNFRLADEDGNINDKEISNFNLANEDGDIYEEDKERPLEADQDEDIYDEEIIGKHSPIFKPLLDYEADLP